MVDVSWDVCVDNGSIVTRAHDTARRAPYGYTRWHSICPVKQIVNYQMRSDVSQNAIICIRQIKTYGIITMLVFLLSMINDDASSRQSMFSQLDFYYFPVHWFLESGVYVDTVHGFQLFLAGIIVIRLIGQCCQIISFMTSKIKACAWLYDGKN